jgi:hypothetical protein
MSFRLFLDEHAFGRLNLYSRRIMPSAMTMAIGAMLASHAAVALTSTRREANLDERAKSRNAIGIAKGILIRSKPSRKTRPSP